MPHSTTEQLLIWISGSLYNVACRKSVGNRDGRGTGSQDVSVWSGKQTSHRIELWLSIEFQMTLTDISMEGQLDGCIFRVSSWKAHLCAVTYGRMWSGFFPLPTQRGGGFREGPLQMERERPTHVHGIGYVVLPDILLDNLFCSLLFGYWATWYVSALRLML